MSALDRILLSRDWVEKNARFCFGKGDELNDFFAKLQKISYIYHSEYFDSPPAPSEPNHDVSALCRALKFAADSEKKSWRLIEYYLSLDSIEDVQDFFGQIKRLLSYVSTKTPFSRAFQKMIGIDLIIDELVHDNYDNQDELGELYERMEALENKSKLKIVQPVELPSGAPLMETVSVGPRPTFKVGNDGEVFFIYESNRN